jgi:hypothetical protein
MSIGVNSLNFDGSLWLSALRAQLEPREVMLIFLFSSLLLNCDLIGCIYINSHLPRKAINLSLT